MPDKHEVGGSSPLGPTTVRGVITNGEVLDVLVCPQTGLGANQLQSRRVTETGIAESLLFPDIVLEETVEGVDHITGPRLLNSFGSQF